MGVSHPGDRTESHVETSRNRMLVLRFRLSGPLAACALAVLACLLLPAVHADVRQVTLPGKFSTLGREATIGGVLSGAMASCAMTLDKSISLEGAASLASQCVLDHVQERAWSAVLSEVTRVVDGHGQRWFGEHFRVISALDYSPHAGAITGNLDLVVPLAFSGTGAGAGASRAFFMQNGLTTWEDERHMRRNDMRYGMVYRFAISSEPNSDILGVSTFYQQNLERNHKVLVVGLDYAGRWGTGAFSYFLPTTDWRSGRLGYEERALEGMEVSARLTLTTALGLEMVAARWEDEESVDRWRTEGRVGLSWKPHPWIHMGIAYTDSSGGVYADAPSFSMRYSRPLGGAHAKGVKPRWQGLGRAFVGKPPDASTAWRPIDNVGRIRYVERVDPDDRDEQLLGKARLRFLQESVGSGDEFGIEVAVAAPLSHQTSVLVRLMPVDEENAAVPGEDYMDEPIEVVIPKGASRAVAVVRLLSNPDLQVARALSVRIASYHRT